MAFCRLVFPLLVLSVVSCYEYESKVPVYIWGDLERTSSKANPLQTSSSSEFRDILDEELVNSPLTIVFTEKSLSVEDFSLKTNGETSFPYLQKNLGNAFYLPSVRGPLAVLEEIAANSHPSRMTLSEDALTEELPAKASETDFIFISLEDAKENESRPTLLKRHDEFMSKTMTEMQKLHDKVVAIYTSEYPSWTIPTTESHSRSRRSTVSSNFTLDGLRLYAESISIVSNNETVALSSAASATTQFGEMTMNTTLVFENDTSLTLNFIQNDFGYWFFPTVTLTLPSLTETLVNNAEGGVYALDGFAYRCADTVSFTSVNETKTYSVVFENLKVQPYFAAFNETPEWGDSFYCVGFFSAPIWAGLFVVFILLSITFYGIMMMLDIRTMDRFDDPKGKTITINAAE